MIDEGLKMEGRWRLGTWQEDFVNDTRFLLVWIRTLIFPT